jgi:putative ABC transport system permease protein
VTLLTVAFRHLRARAVPTVLTVVSIALGVSLVVATVALTRGIRQGFLEGTTDYSLVVGAKGSASQLVLNVVFRMDTATPNISHRTFRYLAADARVDVAVPIAMGDAFQGFRYVATTPAYFATQPWRRRTFAIEAGRFPRDDPAERPSFEAIVGAAAARATGLRVGDRFYEGEEMAEFPLTVVGVLNATGSADDRTIFLSLPSYWAMNEVARKMEAKPLTAVLVRARRMSDLPALHRELNVSAETQAAFPSAVLLDIFNLLGLAEDALAMILAVVAVVVLLYLFVSMYSATLARTREIATMRALGARRTTIFAMVLVESCAMTLVGGLAGILGGHGVAYAGARLLAQRGGFVAQPLAVGWLQPVVLATVVGLGALAGLLPAMLAYRTEVGENLAPLS